MTAVASLAGLSAATPVFAKQAPVPSLLDSAAAAVPNRYAASAVEQILRQGGNAVDAAVAVGFVLAVTSPATAGLGGGGFMTLYMSNQPYFLDFRERAPQGAVPGMYLDPKGKPVPGASDVGGRAVAVPGSVAGLWEAQKRFGKLKWAQVLAPAIELARNGFEVDAALAQRAAKAAPRFSGKTNFSTYFAGLHAGRSLRQPELAATLQQLADDGGNAFYSGHVADLLAEAMRGHGLVTPSDLSGYQAKWRTPLVAPWHGYQIMTASAPSVGGLALVQMLRLRDGLQSGPQNAFDGIGPDSPQYARLSAAIVARAQADLAAYPGDPDSVGEADDGNRGAGVARWIGADYIKRRASEIAAATKADAAPSPAAVDTPASAAMAASTADANGASSAAAASSVASAAAAAPATASAAASSSAAQPTAKPTEQATPKATVKAPAPALASEAARAISTQYAIVDRWGNAVSVSLTMDAPFGAGVVVPGAGFLLNDAMDTFDATGGSTDASATEGASHATAKSGASANTIAGGRRPVSPMAPTILTDGGKAVLVVTAGGAGNPNSLQGPFAQYRVISAIVYEGQALAQAVDVPSAGADIQAVQVQGASPVPQADPRGHGVSSVVK